MLKQASGKVLRAVILGTSQHQYHKQTSHLPAWRNNCIELSIKEAAPRLTTDVGRGGIFWPGYTKTLIGFVCHAPPMQMGEPCGSPMVSFSLTVAQRMAAGIGPHRKSGVIRKPLLPVDSACPCTLSTTIRGQIQVHNLLP